MSIRVFISYLLWPALLGGALIATGFGMQTSHGILMFNAAYLTLALLIAILERMMPHEKSWLKDDQQTFVNIAHTLLNKGIAQVVIAVSLSAGLADALQPPAGSTDGFWPGNWPVLAQVILALTVAELGLYWAHRLAHEIAFLWRFHAVHHSVTRLWFVNTGRFHFVDSILSIAMSQPLLYLMGAPAEIFLWVGAATAFIGILTHCNIEMRFGVLNYVVNTPGLHRWHHSMDKIEGDKNYGENLMVWDLIFATFYNPARRPPAIIGIHGPMPSDFLGQLSQPFKAPAETPNDGNTQR